MAKPPIPPKKNAAPPPTADDDTDDTAGAPGAGDEGAGDEDEGPTVIATIVDNHDGTYTLIHGDEPEEGEGDGEPEDEGGESEGGPEGEEGEDNAAAGTGDEEGEEGAPSEGEEEEGPEQEHFDSPGALLEAVLDILDQAEADNGSGESAFDEGFNEAHGPTPKQ